MLEPRTAGVFCPGFAKTSVGDVHGLLRAPTLTLGDTQKVTSTDSLELQRGTSGDTMDYAALQTPQAKRMAVSPSPYVLVPDANQSPTPGSVNPSSEKVYELDENGWTFVLQSWCKNNPGYQAAFWAKGVDGNVFTFSDQEVAELLPKT